MAFSYNLRAPYLRSSILSAAAVVTDCSVFTEFGLSSFPLVDLHFVCQS